MKKKTFPKWERKEISSIDENNITFPKEEYVAFAVCAKQCGAKAFIVDGQTQVCEYCGKNMFRTEVRKYVLK